MRAYLALLRAGFQRQTSYRLALAAGLTTNALFGVVRTAVFYALYRERDQVAGLDVADALTYVWARRAWAEGRGSGMDAALRDPGSS